MRHVWIVRFIQIVDGKGIDCGLKIHFKYGLCVGVLFLGNMFNLLNILINIVKTNSLFWALIGVAAVLLLFFHAMMISDVLDQEG